MICNNSKMNPVYSISLLIKTNTDTDYTLVKGLNSITIEPTKDVYEWVPADENGWKRNYSIGASLMINLEGERNLNDLGQNKILNLWDKLGEDNQVDVKVVNMQNGETIVGCFLVNISKLGGGASTELSTFSIELQSNGKVNKIDGNTDTDKINQASNLLLAKIFKIPKAQNTSDVTIKAFLKTSIEAEITKIDENISYDDTNLVFTPTLASADVGTTSKITIAKLTLNSATNDATTKAEIVADIKRGK